MELCWHSPSGVFAFASDSPIWVGDKALPFVAFLWAAACSSRPTCLQSCPARVACWTTSLHCCVLRCQPSPKIDSSLDFNCGLQLDDLPSGFPPRHRRCIARPAGIAGWASCGTRPLHIVVTNFPSHPVLRLPLPQTSARCRCRADIWDDTASNFFLPMECIETTVGHGQNSEASCAKLQCVVSHIVPLNTKRNRITTCHMSHAAATWWQTVATNCTLCTICVAVLVPARVLKRLRKHRTGFMPT